MLELVWLMVDGTLVELATRSSSRSSCLCSWRLIVVVVCWPHDDDDDVS